jgi:hypothetical protein
METVPPTSAGNQLFDFPPERFTINLFCDACDHRAGEGAEWHHDPDATTASPVLQMWQPEVLAQDHLLGGGRVSTLLNGA